MDKTVEMVEEFHKAFGMEEHHKPTIQRASNYHSERESIELYATCMKRLSEEMLSLANGLQSTMLLRLHLSLEELSELASAMAEGDKVACLDALCDMRYVADGSILSLGMQGIFSAAFAEVHASNMSKLDEDGLPIRSAAGRVVKSDQYRPPCLEVFLEPDTCPRCGDICDSRITQLEATPHLTTTTRECDACGNTWTEEQRHDN